MTIMKHKKTLRELEAEELENIEEETDSETEALQEAFALGYIKPGLNFPVTKEKKENNVAALREKLDEIKLDLAWVEKLDVTSKPAAMAPELYVQLEQSEKKDPIVHNDFKRESLFYRQAQDAVLSVLPKLRDLGIATQRPDDYFAEMAKSDAHMQKVKIALVKEKTEVERVEKVRALRAQRKLQKAMNAQAKLKKQNSKKELMDQVKKFRKGDSKDLSFLDDKKPKNIKQPIKKKTPNKRAEMKKKYKDSKFGQGGKKRGSKRNTRESTAGIDKSWNRKKQSRPDSKRPGKNARNKMKSKKRSK